MTHTANPVGPRRTRESFGRYYEEFEIGDVYEHRPGRTIGEADNTWFTLLTMNNHPLHFDAVYAAKSEFGRPLVNSCLTLSIVVGMSVSDVSYKAIGNLGWNDIKLPAPVFVGDTLYAESEVLAKRESQSRPTQGIVTVRTPRHESRRQGLHQLRTDDPRAETRPRRRRRGVLTVCRASAVARLERDTRGHWPSVCRSERRDRWIDLPLGLPYAPNPGYALLRRHQRCATGASPCCFSGRLPVSRRSST